MGAALLIEKIQNVSEFRDLVSSGREGKLRWLHYLENVTKKAVKMKATLIRDYLVWLMLENSIDIDDC